MLALASLLYCTTKGMIRSLFRTIGMMLLTARIVQVIQVISYEIQYLSHIGSDHDK
jgi:hypothetical protein